MGPTLKERRAKLNRIMNYIAAELVAQPKHKYLFLLGMKDIRLGKRVVISPGTRLKNSKIGDDVNIGLGAIIEDSVIDNGVYITANAIIRRCHIGKGSIVGANAHLEDMEIPPNMVVTAQGIMKPIEEYKNKRPKRMVEVHFYNRNPMWYWTVVARDEGMFRLPAAVPHHIIINHIPRWLKSNTLKVRLSASFCHIESGVKIHHTVILDPIFPNDISIGEDSSIEPDCIILTHSFLGFGDYRLEHGKTSIGSGVKIGKHSVVIPGVSIPDDTCIPEFAVATKNGVYIVKECTYRRYEEL